MSNKISIIEYHYVRDLKRSEYPKIKGLEVELFKSQLNHILKNYKVIRMEDLLEAAKSGKKLPDNSLILTFDDGYRDHFEFVFPILSKLGLQGSFFPSARAMREKCVLDVNKIHFLLASIEDKKMIIKDIFSYLDKYGEEYSLVKNDFYYKKLAVNGRYDAAEIIFIKLMLQRELPENLRVAIIAELFKKYVSQDEKNFSEKLYMDLGQLKQMKKSGMHIGSHSYDHCWLDAMPREKQEKQIDLSLEFLREINGNASEWVMCYPYGACNDSLISVIKEKGCALGLIEGNRIADLESDNIYVFPRLDTNDLPRH